MYNVKIFPSCGIPPHASEEDSLFLAEIEKVTKDASAVTVNFSSYLYRSDILETVHFITHSIDWVMQYIEAHYTEIDPLLTLDYRQISYVDWSELQTSKETRQLFANFREMGNGNSGATLASYIGANHYGVISFIFETGVQSWQPFDTSKIELLRLLSKRLSENYTSIFGNAPARKLKITKRETECLFWVAMGKTDEEIGEILYIGKWTVVGHLKSAKQKLGCANRASAVATAMSLGIIDIAAHLSIE